MLLLDAGLLLLLLPRLPLLLLALLLYLELLIAEHFRCGPGLVTGVGFPLGMGRFGGCFSGGEDVGGRGGTRRLLEQNEAKGGGNNEAAHQWEGRCLGNIHLLIQIKMSVGRVGILNAKGGAGVRGGGGAECLL